jgi:parallel beta-helix repeat protein
MAVAPASGVRGVVVSGFTIANAKYEGIVVANATGVTIADNTLIGNDKALVFAGADSSCPDLPAFETNEAFDCGEAIHLTGVDHSTIANNVIQRNAGGILLADETGATFENVITGNVVTDNDYDCGITIASHTRAPGLPPGLSFGIFHNTISRNQAVHNGSLGAGSGVGIYAPGPGSAAWGNVVVNNVLRDNGIGGVSMHNHAAAGVNGVPAAAPPVMFNDNVIVGNDISGNGPDDDDPASPGATGISIVGFSAMYGTVISQNTFGSEVADIVFSAPGSVEAHLNNFTSYGIAVQVQSGSYVDASQSFFGFCADGPGTPGCATNKGSGVIVTSWAATPSGIGRFGRPF